MKLNRAFLIFVVLLGVLGQLACSDPPAESYSRDHWPRLMANFSDLDKKLGSISRLESSTKNFKHFEDSLAESGMSKNLLQNLTSLLQNNDKKFDGPAYHGLVHSTRIANLVASVLNTPKANNLSAEQKIMLIVAAMFHDVDPKRAEGTPPRVWATYEWMDHDKKAIEVFDELRKEKNISSEQIKTLIKFTDFDIDPKKRAALKAEAEGMASQNFADGGAFAKKWGAILEFCDQTNMYVGSRKFARQAVVGLAQELRLSATKAKMANGTYTGEVTSPSDAAILSGTEKFLASWLSGEYLQWLPEEMQENLKDVHRYFSEKWSGRKYI